MGILDWCLEQIHHDNSILRMRIKDLEALLNEERAKSLQVCISLLGIYQVFFPFLLRHIDFIC